MIKGTSRNNSDVVVFNSSWMPIGKTTIEKAIVLIYLGKAHTTSNTNKSFRSPSIEIKVPKAIRLPDVNFIKRNLPQAPSRKNIFERDQHTCQYCGYDLDKRNLNIDHVIPRNRWNEFKDKLDYGLNSSRNLVCSCRHCNQSKSDRLLSELGWPQVFPKELYSEITIDWEYLMVDASQMTDTNEETDNSLFEEINIKDLL